MFNSRKSLTRRIFSLIDVGLSNSKRTICGQLNKDCNGCNEILFYITVGLRHAIKVSLVILGIDELRIFSSTL